MKLSLKTFTAKKLEFAFHLKANEDEIQTTLASLVDTTMAFKEETLLERFEPPEKIFKGNIRPNYFEVVRKYRPFEFETYESNVVRGEMQAVGSNFELMITTFQTKKQNGVKMTFVVFPLIILILTFFKESGSQMDYLVIGFCIVMPVLYHVFSRWVQFRVISRLVSDIGKQITLWEIQKTY